MTTSFRSLRCLSRRALARISIIVMFGESSMYSGASATSPIRRASFDQSSSDSVPARMWCSGTCASADSRRIVISCLLISSEKMHGRLVVLHRCIARNIKAQRRFADTGPGGDDDHLAGMEAIGQLVEVANAGGHAAASPPREAMASISSIVGCSSSSRSE